MTLQNPQEGTQDARGEVFREGDGSSIVRESATLPRGILDVLLNGWWLEKVFGDTDAGEEEREGREGGL